MSRYLLGKVTELSYRPDIDGLRALAVLSVLFYHVGFTAFQGGFVGVDIFFVISGYLITRNIASETQKGRFSYAQFYLRRARRLFPALFFTLLISFIVGALILIPYHLADFAHSLIFSLIPASNIYFWKEAGYFSTDSILKPLLHTWSLSVEEQFYLVWPTLLIFLFTLKRSWVSLFVMIAAGISSLVYAQVRLSSDPSSVFFLTQYRAIEFILGALCVWLVNHRPENQLSRELALVTGLSMVLYAMFSYSSHTPFPGFSALLPSLGAVLVIYASSPHFTGKLLSNPLAVGIGLISYSLYLIHWPLLVFLTYIAEGAPYLPYAVVLGSLALATLMYFYVETPFRKPKPGSITFGTKPFILIITGLSCILILTALSAWKSGGWSWRMPAQYENISADVAPEKAKRFSIHRSICEARGWDLCSEPNHTPNTKNIIVIGDSHAIDALNTLYSIDKRPNYILSEAGGCPPLVREDYKLLGPRHPNLAVCLQRNEDRLHGNLLKQADLIVINVLFDWYKPENLKKAISEIKLQTSAPIWVFGNYMVLNHDLPDLILKAPNDFTGSVEKKWLSNATFIYESQLQELSTEQGFTYLSKKTLLCDGQSTESCPTVLSDGKLFTYDKHHLSVSTTELLGRQLQKQHPELMKMLN